MHSIYIHLIIQCFTRYGIIASVSTSGQEATNVVKEKCTKILKASKVESSGFQIGITKVLSLHWVD